MFGGIVEMTGQIQKTIQKTGYLQLMIRPDQPDFLADVKTGDSIAVNGVCLTVVQQTEKNFQVQVVPETLALTTLGLLAENEKVNLERALRVSDRIGGHMVQGHVDCCGEILALDTVSGQPDVLLAKIGCQAAQVSGLVCKGYVALDGMSITVIEVMDAGFSVTLIPHTWHHTIAKYYTPGKKINIEFDILGKYIGQHMKRYTQQ